MPSSRRDRSIAMPAAIMRLKILTPRSWLKNMKRYTTKSWKIKRANEIRPRRLLKNSYLFVCVVSLSEGYAWLGKSLRHAEFYFDFVPQVLLSRRGFFAGRRECRRRITQDIRVSEGVPDFLCDIAQVKITRVSEGYRIIYK